MNKYLFVLSPPYSGSTVLWKLLASSPNVSALPKEGQFLEGVREVMRRDAWNPDKIIPWDMIKAYWDSIWDQSQPILLEKSPPNLCRAFDIEKAFVPSYFIAMIQNPYAHCQGLVRRGSKLAEGMDGAATFWVQCAQYQKKNIEGLGRIIHFTYEALTQNPWHICEQMIMFMPELRQLDADAPISTESVIGAGPKKIVNFSQLKIDLLSTRDISSINRILKNHRDLMEFFGYNYIEPTLGHQVRRMRAIISVNLTRTFRRIKTLRRRITNRVFNRSKEPAS